MNDSHQQRRWIGGRIEGLVRRGVTQRAGAVFGEVSFVIAIDREHCLEPIGPQPKQPFSQRYWSPSNRDGLDYVLEGQAVDFDVTTWDDFRSLVHEIVDQESGAMIWRDLGPGERPVCRGRGS